MSKARNLSLFTTVLLWATLVGAIMYSHIVFLPSYLHHLPASTSLIKGPYGLVDERFWMLIHPVLILSLLAAILLNWKLQERRKYMLSAVGIYVIVLITTFSFFVPELKAFADSANSNLTAAEWLQRGKRWEMLSWVRGAFMYLGFALLLFSFAKSSTEEMVVRPQKNRRPSVEKV